MTGPLSVEVTMRFAPGLFAGLALALLLAGCPANQVVVQTAGAPAAGEVRPGGVLPGLSAPQQAQFERGRFLFSRSFSPATGLGPVFNDTSCRACHGTVAAGGHSERAVLLAGAQINGGPSLLESEGGPMIQAFSVAGTPVEQVPRDATAVTRRISPAIWGIGLVEAVPDAQVLAQMLPSEEKNALGIRGLANFEAGKLGRLGDKAQKSDLVTFSQQAYNWEMGLATPGRLEKPVANGPARPVDHPDIPAGDFDDVVAFQRFLAPPARGAITASVKGGEAVFARIGCALCHTPALVTGPNALGIPENLPVGAYSDYLVHAMDDVMADQMTQGLAGGQMFRTSPLWGLRWRKLYLHDGRASTLDDAIALHGGEAAQVRDRALALSPDDQGALKAFLDSL